MTGADTRRARARVLLDTGPLVALLNADDRDHRRCRDWLERFDGLLVSTEPVLTEATHLLARDRSAQGAAIEFFERRGAVLVPLTLPSLRACRELMERYENVPMDLADATLVTLAKELDIRDVFTLDRRGFSTYRVGHRRALRLHPN